MAKQSGFSIVAFVVLLAVIVAAGLGGWLVWHKHQQAHDTAPLGTTAKPARLQPQQMGTDPTDGGTYLVITEWDVRIPVPDQLKGDIAYGIYTQKSGDQNAYFASKALIQKAPDSYCALKQVTDENGQGISGGTFALERTKQKPEPFNAQSFYNDATGYWYTPGAANGGACYDGDDGTWRSTFNAPLSEAVKQLEPTTRH
jgi:hypothetical protein